VGGGLSVAQLLSQEEVFVHQLSRRAKLMHQVYVKCVAVWCSVLQRVAVCCNVL